MRALKLLLCALVLTGMGSCKMARQTKGAYNMATCKYEYQSVGDITISGINVSNGISLLDAPRIINVLTGDLSAVPFGFTVNLAVTNPNSSAAIFSGLDYILSIDDIDFTAGSIGNKFSVPAGGTSTLPVVIFVDIATMLKSDTHDAVANIVKNFIGMGNDPSKVTLNIRPSFTMAGYKVPSPVYIPISFSFGGR